MHTDGKEQPDVDKRLSFGRRSLQRALRISGEGFGAALLLHFMLEYFLKNYKIAPPFGSLTEVLSEGFLHLAIGFLVAGIVVWAIEFDSKRTTHQEIKEFVDLVHQEIHDFVDLVSKDVFKAVLERIVPDPVFTEVKNVLLSEVSRTDCRYRITLLRGQAPQGYFVIRRELGFTVQNRLDRNVFFPVRSTHVSDDATPISLEEAGRHFHLLLTIDEGTIPLEPNKNLFLRDGRIVLEHALMLAPGTSARIFLKGEEQTRIEAGQNSYLQGTPVVGIEVEVKNEYPDVIGVVDVQMNHPSGSAMRRNEFGRYFLDRAFLPGQGFYIVWRKVQAGQADEPLAAGG
ncbi:MAG: hypothetical protein ABUT39_22875 [Acidobacteriota bacterium]